MMALLLGLWRGARAFAYLVPGWLWCCALVGALAADAVHSHQARALREELAQIKADHAIATTEALRRSAAAAQSLQEKKDVAIAQAETRATQNAAAAAGARTELDRLRQQATGGARAAGASPAACTHYAATANTVLSECAGALVSLADAADGHVNDLRTARDAWPAWDKFAGQMTDFTNRMKGL